MKITIIGAGHVGLVTGACFAELNNKVICVDDDVRKIEMLKRGKLPFYEPGLEEIVKTNLIEGWFSFSEDIKEAILSSEIIFICVGTPSLPSGGADLSSLEKIASQIAESLNGYKLIVEKSTVPVQTGEWLVANINEKTKRLRKEFDIASNPEFLKEGSAIYDFMHPDRIIIGVSSERATSLLVQLYSPLNAPILITDIKSAELIKHASNSFLSMKISFINAIANICERTGADILKVAKGIGLDKRIGEDFLNAGIGYGGYCLPKDLSAFIHIAKKLGYKFKLLEEVRNINEYQRNHFLKKVEKTLKGFDDKTIAILGLSFKPNTDDIREAPALYIIKELVDKKVGRIQAFDPQAMENMKRIYPHITYSKSPYEAVKDADALLLLTEWENFKYLDLRKIKSFLKKPILADGRNLYDPKKMKSLGFEYISVGR